MTGDPLQQAAAARRARKRRRARAVEEEAERRPPLVLQGGRSSMPRRARPGPDELIRAAVFELQGRASRIRL